MILNGLLPLAVAALVNIGLGIYNKVGVESVPFNWRTLVGGALKAALVGGAFVGLSYCFGTTGLGGELVTPKEIMAAALLLYMGKCTRNLMAVLGVTLPGKAA